MRVGGHRGLLGVLLLALLVLPGCAPARPDPEALAAQLTTAVATRDRAGFDAVVGGIAAGQREWLWGNLQSLDAVSFTPGAEAWQVSWRLPGEQGLAWHWVGVETECASECTVSAIGQAPGHPTPIWLTGPIVVYQSGSVRIIGADAAADWLPAAEQAIAQLQAGPAELLRLPDLLVIEAPDDRASFEAVLAAPATDFADTGAISWWADTARPADASEAAVHRIVIKPEVTAGLGEPGQALLLAHEGVHVATGWLGQPVAGRKWVSEGLAEAVSLPLSADEQARSLAHLTTRCPLDAVPADSEFNQPGTTLGAYAWAGWAVGQLLELPDGAVQVEVLWTDSSAPNPEVTASSGLCS